MGTPTLELDALLAHDDFVRALARSLIADPHAADDVAQETWLAALRRPPVAGTPPRAWLATVVRNFARRARRTDVRRAALERRAASSDVLPSTAQIVEREAARRALVEAVLELAEPYRSTILLRYFEGLPPRALARRFDVPVSTVRTRLYRALDQLRARLDRESGGDRSAWCLALAPLAFAKPATASAAWITGAIMNSTAKIGLGAAALVMLGASLGYWAGSAKRHEEVARAFVPAAPLVAESRGATAPESASRPAMTTVAPTAPAHEEPPTASSSAAESTPIVPPPAAPDAFADSLARITETFLTDEPDVTGFLQFARQLGSAAHVDPESIEREDGVVTGKVTFRDSAIDATFTFEEGRFGVTLRRKPGAVGDLNCVGQDSSLSFTSDNGVAANAGFVIQFHPDLRQPPDLARGVERGIGYDVELGTNATRMRAVVLGRGPERGSWQIGRPNNPDWIDRPPLDATPFDVWLHLLEPHLR